MENRILQSWLLVPQTGEEQSLANDQQILQNKVLIFSDSY